MLNLGQPDDNDPPDACKQIRRVVEDDEMLISQVKANGAESHRGISYFCAGCEEWVPAVIGYKSGRGSTPLCSRCSRIVTCDCCQRTVPFGLCEVDHHDAVFCVDCGGRVSPGCSIPSDEADCGGRVRYGSCGHRDTEPAQSGATHPGPERPLCLEEAVLAALPFLEAGQVPYRWVVRELRRTIDELVESARDRPGDGHGKCYDDGRYDDPFIDEVTA